MLEKIFIKLKFSTNLYEKKSKNFKKYAFKILKFFKDIR